MTTSILRPTRLTIFEGPDGGGKTTAANAYAMMRCAQYVHFDQTSSVYDYAEGVWIAFSGKSEVVFDRSWLSERPYGLVYRGGLDRLQPADRVMLERLAFYCDAVVVKCMPPLETVLRNYEKRRSTEMLSSADQLAEVYRLYMREPTRLPVLFYDYTADDAGLLSARLNETRYGKGRAR